MLMPKMSIYTLRSTLSIPFVLIIVFVVIFPFVVIIQTYNKNIKLQHIMHNTKHNTRTNRPTNLPNILISNPPKNKHPQSTHHPTHLFNPFNRTIITTYRNNTPIMEKILKDLEIKTNPVLNNKILEPVLRHCYLERPWSPWSVKPIAGASEDRSSKNKKLKNSNDSIYSLCHYGTRVNIDTILKHKSNKNKAILNQLSCCKRGEYGDCTYVSRLLHCKQDVVILNTISQKNRNKIHNKKKNENYNPTNPWITYGDDILDASVVTKNVPLTDDGHGVCPVLWHKKCNIDKDRPIKYQQVKYILNYLFFILFIYFIFIYFNTYFLFILFIYFRDWGIKIILK